MKGNSYKKFLMAVAFLAVVGTASFGMAQHSAFAVEEAQAQSSQVVVQDTPAKSEDQVSLSKQSTPVVSTSSQNEVGLVRTDKGIQYKNPDGTLKKNQWHTENGNRYYFDKNGYALVGRYILNNKTLVFNKDGILQEDAQEVPDDQNLQSTGWKTLDGKRYYYVNGKPVTGRTIVEGKTFIFDSKGVLQTWYTTQKGEKGYCDPETGIVERGWKTIDGEVYYFKNFSIMKEIVNINGKRYYFDWKNGNLYRNGWLQFKFNKKWIYADKTTGEFLVGKQYIEADKATYYFDEYGYRQRGIVHLEGKSYYFDWNTYKLRQNEWIYFHPYKSWVYAGKDGAFTVGKQTIDGKIYLFNEKGFRQRGIQKIDGKSYYFDWNNGDLYHNGWLYFHPYKNKVYTDKNTGEFLTGLQKIEGKTYYLNKETGLRERGIVTLDNKRYYFDWNNYNLFDKGWLYFNPYSKWAYCDPKQNGAFLVGKQQVNGNEFPFDSNGLVKLGWFKGDGGMYYVDRNHGMCKDGVFSLDDGRYFFDKNGFRQRGILSKDGKSYYFDWNTYKAFDNGWLYIYPWKSYVFADPDSKGAFLKGQYKLNGRNYTFDDRGAVVKGTVPESVSYTRNLTSPTNYLIYVDKARTRTEIFKRGYGEWILQHSWRCTVGRYSTPTPTGTFKIMRRWNDEHFGLEHGYSAWYFSNFYGECGFHSLLYQPWSKKYLFQQGQLGKHWSNGCIRLELDNAKWLYNNIPDKTTVHIVGR